MSLVLQLYISNIFNTIYPSNFVPPVAIPAFYMFASNMQKSNHRHWGRVTGGSVEYLLEARRSITSSL